MPDTTPRLQRKCGCGGSTASGESCQECASQSGQIQRDATPENNSSAATAPSIVHDVLRLPGQPLDQSTRAFFESRMGHDFAGVRVHTDAKAAKSAQAVNALAYTVGRDVVFGEGQFAPGTGTGRQIIAHELSHVVQQSNGNAGGGGLVLGELDSIHEREAESVSARLSDTTVSDSAGGQSNGMTKTQSDVVQRVAPAALVGGAAAAGALIGYLSFEASESYGRSLATRFPGWLGVLPNCPCHEADVQADTATWGRDQNPLLSWFHPGATASYRSNATFSTVPGSAHGQQCTYAGGNLITEGPGAGTPDSWSPVTHGGNHFLYDVSTWQVLGWRIYDWYWQPNNGNHCGANRGENTFGRRFSEFMP